MKNISVYTTPTCGYCHMLKDYLSDKGIEFNEIDISASFDATNWVLNHTGKIGVPVIDIDGEIIVGFDREKIDLALNIKASD
jgi:glutaredoxin-like YruB-family protein